MVLSGHLDVGGPHSCCSSAVAHLHYTLGSSPLQEADGTDLKGKIMESSWPSPCPALASAEFGSPCPSCDQKKRTCKHGAEVPEVSGILIFRTLRDGENSQETIKEESAVRLEGT
jgi:hypothetical protein